VANSCGIPYILWDDCAGDRTTFPTEFVGGVARLPPIGSRHPRCSPASRDTRCAVNFALVHGAWQTSQAWEDVESALVSAHNAVWTVPLIGCSDQPANRTGITLTSMAALLAGDLKDQDRGALVLVGHAEAGPLVQLAAAALPDRVRRVVIVGGPVLRTGESIASVHPERYAAVAATGADRADQTAALDEAVWQHEFAGGAPPATWRGRFRSLGCPAGWLTDRPELEPFWDLHRLAVLPVSYISLRDDPAAPLYDALAQRLTDPVTATVPGPLAAPLTDPSPLAAALVAVSRW
jgi:pimeloyl-ACP methyl ester carboxylesterase